MELEDDDMEYEKMEEAHARYLRLHAIVEEIKSGPLTRNTEWYAEQNHLLNIYDRHFGDFTTLHPEIENEEFRLNCRTLSFLMKKITKDYNQYRWFGLYEYLEFNQILILVVDYVFEITDTEEELGALFKDMGV
jgi:hypothetical protein